MFKEYRLIALTVIVFAAIITFGVKCAANRQQHAVERIETPLPLNSVSEQILYRKGYTVSYNKDHKIPNWVAWHLTAEHASGPHRRPGGAWHTDGSKAKDFYVNSISQVERITGITFFPTLPKDIAKSVKSNADLNAWDQKTPSDVLHPAYQLLRSF